MSVLTKQKQTKHKVIKIMVDKQKKKCDSIYSGVGAKTTTLQYP
jgi:hypothetical protein